MMPRIWRNVTKTICGPLSLKLSWRNLPAVAIAMLFALAANVNVAHAYDPALPAPTVVQLIDPNGVNLTNGEQRIVLGTVSVGQPGKGGLTYSTEGNEDPNWLSSVQHNTLTGIYTVTLMGQPEEFPSGIGYPGLRAGTLTLSGSTYTYTRRDGTVAIFAASGFTCSGICTDGLISSLTYPSGETLTFVVRANAYLFELASINSSLGYQIKINYQCTNPTLACFNTLSSVLAINNASDYCDPTANSCTGLSHSWPTLTFAFSTSGTTSTLQLTDAVGNITTLTYTQTTVGTTVYWTRRVTRPSGRYLEYSGNFCFGCDPQHNQNVTDGVSTWQYFIVPDAYTGTPITATIIDPLGHTREVITDPATGFPTSDTIDKGGSGHLNLLTTYTNDTAEITSVTYPLGNTSTYTYVRGNITQVRTTGWPGHPADVSTTAVYPSSCNSSNYRICNKPTSITDANGNTTDYTYDPAHGGMLTETGPAVGGGRPQTRYTYDAKYAWYRNAPPGPLWGTAVWNSFNWTSQNTQASAPVYVLTQTSKCISGSSCTGTSQESVATTTYVTGNSGLATNLLPASSSIGSGDAAITTTTSLTYDDVCNVATATGPNPADVKAFFYNANRQQIGLVGPDPDGAGSLKNPATRTTYDGDGRVSEIEQGTVPGEAWSDWGSFASLTQQTFGYDSTTGAKVRDAKAIGGTTQSVTQYSYDSARRQTCTAVRENAAVFGSLPSSACNQSTNGSFGPDRIGQNNYDAADRLTSVVIGYNTSGVTPITTVTNSYTANSKIASVTDANNNLSAYTYDGLDRLVQLNFPSATLGSGTASATDYEQYNYDGNGNRTSLRLRSGETISYTYDALNRQTLKDIPGGSSSDVYSGYDLVGDLLYAHYGSAGGSGIDYTWDALGRKLTETSYGRTVSSQYDVAGNRTRLTYPDSNYIQYTYDVLNRMQQVQQNGSTALATYAYDDLSRVSGISRPNSTATSMSYSGTSQNWSLTQDMSGTSQDVTFGLTFTPASQIYQRSLSNTAYAYSAPAAARSYTSNGLNQYSVVGGASFGYDGRGNLTGDGSRTFSYDLENRLTGVSGSASMTMGYDPRGRLQQTAASSTEQYLYDGDSLIAEYNISGTVLRRYVPGRGVDENLVWYEGSSLSTPNWLQTDQQGSTVAVSNSSGVATIYAYSPSGEPYGGWGSTAATPIFRYTGQAALPQIGLYYYKARMYDPVLGRFLQTDPIGYMDDYNLYAYVKNDPANGTDPTGDCDGVGASRICGPSSIQSLNAQPGATRDNEGFPDTNGKPVSAHVDSNLRVAQGPLGLLARGIAACAENPICRKQAIALGGATALAILNNMNAQDKNGKKQGVQPQTGPSNSGDQTKDPDRPSDRAIKNQCIAKCSPLLENPQRNEDQRTRDFNICLRACIKEKNEYWGYSHE